MSDDVVARAFFLMVAVGLTSLVWSWLVPRVSQWVMKTARSAGYPELSMLLTCIPAVVLGVIHKETEEMTALAIAMASVFFAWTLWWVMSMTWILSERSTWVCKRHSAFMAMSGASAALSLVACELLRWQLVR